MIGDGFDFSFSGLKTAVLYAVRASDDLERDRAHLARGFQDAVLDVLVTKLERAVRETHDSQDYQAIRKAIDALNEGTTHLAELMMDSAVSTALKGKTMDGADVGEGPDAPHPVAKAEFE